MEKFLKKYKCPHGKRRVSLFTKLNLPHIEMSFDRITKTFKNVVEHLLQNKFSFHLKLGEKKLNQNFLWICASTHYVLYNY